MSQKHQPLPADIRAEWAARLRSAAKVLNQYAKAIENDDDADYLAVARLRRKHVDEQKAVAQVVKAHARHIITGLTAAGVKVADQCEALGINRARRDQILKGYSGGVYTPRSDDSR